MSREKRVRFAEYDTVHPLNFKPDAFPTAKGTHASRSEDPKTSEYAFYKKLREDTGHYLHSYPLHKQDIQLKKFGANNYSGEMNVVQDNSEGTRSLLPFEKFAFTGHKSSLSLHGASNTTEMTNMVEDNSGAIRSLLPFEKFAFTGPKSTLSPYGASKITGPQDRREELFSRKGVDFSEAKIKLCFRSQFSCGRTGPQDRHEELFSSKRKKLLQWVADSSSVGVDECCSKGYDLVSVLLRRLVPESNVSNSWMDLRSRNIKLNTKSQLPASPESDSHSKEQVWSPSMNSMALSTGEYFGEGSLTCRPNNSREIILSHSGSSGFESFNSLSNGPDDRIHLQYKRRQVDPVLDGGRTTSLHTKSESEFGVDQGTELSFERCGSLTWDHLPLSSKFDCSAHENLFLYFDSLEQSPISNRLSFKVLDEFHDSNELPLQMQHYTQLLGWDGDDKENEAELALTSHNTLLNLKPTSSTSWGDGQQCFVPKFGEVGLFSSSLRSSDHPPSFTTWPDFYSESYPVHTIGRQVPEDGDYPIAEPDHFPLALSCIPNYPIHAVADDCKFSGTYKGSSLFLSPPNHCRYMSEVFGEKLHPCLDALLLSSGLDFRWKFLSVNDSFGEHPTNHDSPFLREELKAISSYPLTEEKFKMYLESSNHVETHYGKDKFCMNDFPSFSFKVSLNKESVGSMLFDKSSWDGYEDEISCEYDKDTYN